MHPRKHVRCDYWLYFLQGENSHRIKIGIAICPSMRLIHLARSCTEKLTLLGLIYLGMCTPSEARRKESQMHRLFCSTRAYGEIFEESKHLLDHISLHAYDEHSKCPRCPKHPHKYSDWKRRAQSAIRKHEDPVALTESQMKILNMVKQRMGSDRKATFKFLLNATGQEQLMLKEDLRVLILRRVLRLARPRASFSGIHHYKTLNNTMSVLAE